MKSKANVKFEFNRNKEESDLAKMKFIRLLLGETNANNNDAYTKEQENKKFKQVT